MKRRPFEKPSVRVYGYYKDLVIKDTSGKHYLLKDCTFKGYYHDGVEMMDEAARVPGFEIGAPKGYLLYTREERELLDTLPSGQVI